MALTFRKQVSPKVFKAVQNLDIDSLCECSADEIRPVLPCLVRLGLISPLDTSHKCSSHKVRVLTIISAMEWVNSIVALLSINFHMLEVDVKKEQQLRQKVGNTQNESVLIGSLSNGLALEYERSDMTRRLRLVLSELLFIQSQIQDGGESEQDFYIKPSDLFDNEIYVEEIADVICIALAELPTILHISQMVEVLLHVSNGPAIICRIVANFPDAFREICTQLIQKGEKQEENISSNIRAVCITLLCRMNPASALAVRSKCVQLCRMPALAVTLSLPLHHASHGDDNDMVAFITGLLLGSDQQVRAWFALFVRTGQKRKGEVSSCALQQLRDELLSRVQRLLTLVSSSTCLPDGVVVQAAALLRLYCALRGIAAIKFQDEEVNALVQLLTSHPNATPAGVRFASIGLCMLIACPSLISNTEHERKAIEWVQWLVREEAYFESASGVAASFGEMLLLMAIHFHSNQLSAICDLACSTLGMKMPIRHNNMTRMKQVFTQEIFSEPVVAQHAVKVAVTRGLHAGMSGFLPVHCIHQLLKSRAFTKHNVNIKSWIYRQICTATHPLHPVLPQLVEVYVGSIITPNQTAGGRVSAAGVLEASNKPLSEDEIRRVFQNSIFGQYLQMKKVVEVSSDSDAEIANGTLAPQLLLLFYLLMYEDCRLTHASHVSSSGRKVKTYSVEFFSELPIKYLLQHAQKDQNSYATLFAPLLKLLATHFPHLTLVDDWVDHMEMKGIVDYGQVRPAVDDEQLLGALDDLRANPSKLAKVFKQLLRMEPLDIWPFAERITQHSIKMLDEHVPRYLQDLYKEVWFKLNTVLPRRLWVMTVKSLLRNCTGLTRIDVAEDPMQILRCDQRVFRCAPMYNVVLRVVRASLASSRSQLLQHLQASPKLDPHGQVVNDAEREDMCRALIAAQSKRTRSQSPPTASRETLIDFSDNAHDLREYLEDNLQITDSNDFFRFYTKYLSAHRQKTQTNPIDRNTLFVITFKQQIKHLHTKFPSFSRNGRRLVSSQASINVLLEAVRTYQDFQQRNRFNKLKQLRQGQANLPIAAFRTQIIDQLHQPGVLLIAGDTGCGKSTQLPQYVLEAGFQRVAVTQPRRLACTSLANRVAHETLSTYRHRIGFQIRFEKQANKTSNVIFLTEGILLRQAADGDVLRSYDAIVLDEVHERHLNMDFLIGILKVVRRQSKLKLVLMSATINLELFQQYFANDDVHTIQVPGRLFPIDINYRPVVNDAYDPRRPAKSDRFDCQPYLSVIEMIDAKYKPHEKGDVLVFLQGLQEIQKLAGAVEEYAAGAKDAHWIVLQLHSSLSLEEQDKVFYQAPDGVRKCIVATNIAETSVTIDGVRFVVDSGKCNRMLYERCEVNRLFTTDISQDSAKQRCGRAGRTGPGHCYRLYSEEQMAAFDAFTPGEIHLVPLEQLVLNMVTLGLSDIHKFPFLERPSEEKLVRAIDRLLFLEALQKDGFTGGLCLTPLGDAMSKLPVDLTIGKMLITSTIFGMLDAALTLASLISVQAPLNETRFYETRDVREPYVSNHGEPITLLNLYKGWLEVKLDATSFGEHRRDSEKESSRKWCRSRGVEEQRFYEVTKLVAQFREILQDAELLPRHEADVVGGRERQIRNGELKQLRKLRYDLKNQAKGAQRKLKHSRGREDDEEPDSHDLKDIEFRITNDFSKVQRLLAETKTDSFRDLVLLKLLLTSALYPQVAVEDEFNSSKTVNERLFHTMYKKYVFLRPTSFFSENSDFFNLHDSDVEEPPIGFLTKRPLSTKHQLLVYQKILETRKTYLMNVFRMPVLQTLLLFGRRIATNRTCTQIAVDDFAVMALPLVGQGVKCIMEAQRLRKAMRTLLNDKLESKDMLQQQNHQQKDPKIGHLLNDLISFMASSPVYNVQRLLPADIKTMFTFQPSSRQNSWGTNPFDVEQDPVPDDDIGGVRVSPNLTWDALPMNGYDLEIESTILSIHVCDKCNQQVNYLDMWESFTHSQLDCAALRIDGGERVEATSVIQQRANTKLFKCAQCDKEFQFTPVETLKHKKFCVPIKQEQT